MFMAVDVFVKDIKLHLNGLNEMLSIHTNKQLSIHLEIKKKLCDTFELQGNIREFSTNDLQSDYEFYERDFFPTELLPSFRVLIVS